jgi:aspartyl-tRNA(Asn)/glutamyl-tRNA(Gln) amidotransferase subunit C
VSAEKIDVHYVAKLARIELTEEEAQAFAGQLEDIVAHVQQLDKADISSLSACEAQLSPTDATNHLRADELRPSLPTKKVLNNAPESADGEIVMPKIVE